MAMQLLARCRKEGINLTLNQVLRSKSLAHLAQSIDTTAAYDHGTEITDVAFPLSPIQRFYFQNISAETSSPFNQSFTLRLSKTIDFSRVRAAFDAIVACHSMLRARFVKNDRGDWLQKVPNELHGSYTFEKYEHASLSTICDIISNTQESLDIEDGPVFAVNAFNIENGEQILFITAHHLVVDVVSWKIILSDLEECLTAESFVSLPRGLPFQVWMEKQANRALEPNHIETLGKLPFTATPADLPFWGMENHDNLYGDVERDAFTVAKEISAMALNDHSVLRTDVIDLFIAAVAHSFSRVFINRTSPTIFNETHGREVWESANLDLSRTVGWFTVMYPVHIPIAEDEDDVVHTVRQVKDLRRKITENGRPYFAHRFLTEDGRRGFANQGPMEILFNYLGKSQHFESEPSLFTQMHLGEDEETKISDLGTKTNRPALFEISASVVNEQIQFVFMYNRWMKNQKGIRRWITECQRTLEEVVNGLAKIGTPQPTLSDFPLLPLESYGRLERVMKVLTSAGILSYDQIEDIYPCVAMQEGMILSQIKEPDSYWSSSTFEMKAKSGSIDVQKVAKSWEAVVNRHPALRTTFADSVCKGVTFDQIVLKHPDSGLLVYTCEDTELPMKLDSITYGSLNGKKKPRLPHQFTIVQTSSGRVVVKLEINHAVIDGASHAVIRRDLEDAYEGRLPDEEGPLYSAYVKYLRDLPAQMSVDYWKERLQEVKPCYFPITPQHSTKQRQLHSLHMNFDQFPNVQTLAERNNVTFANILLAVWALVLRTYTGSSDVCYGYLTSGRNVPIDNIQNAVGAFINMLVSRIRVSQSLSLLEIIQKVQADFIKSLPYQHCSLAQFQHDLGLSGKALFNTAVSIQNHGATEGQHEESRNVVLEHLDAYDPSEFAITVNIDATRNDEGVRLSYWTDSVSDDEAHNIFALMTKILGQLLMDTSQTVGELDAAIQDKAGNIQPTGLFPKSRSLTLEPSFSVPDPPISLPVPKIETSQNPAPIPTGSADWSSLIRSIVSEMVPQIVDQVLAKNKLVPAPAQSTVNEMTNQMAGMLVRKASQSLRGRPNFETNSLRSRRMSTASDAESRINIAADMVAAAGVMATEALKSVPPNFVEKKLLALWSELLDMVEESIGKEDSFFVSAVVLNHSFMLAN